MGGGMLKYDMQQSCPLNYETVQDAESATIRDCLR